MAAKKDNKKKKKAQAQNPDKPIKGLKPPKKRNVRAMTTARNILYFILVAIFVMGIFVIVRMFTRGDGTATVRAELQTTTAAINTELVTRSEAEAFAQCFVSDYFTYESRQADNYKLRLLRYCDSQLAGEMADNIVLYNMAEAVYVQAVDTVQYNQNQYDVTVKADIQYTRTIQLQSNTVVTGTTSTGIPEARPEPTIETTKSTVYVVVPVWSNGGGGYAVEDMPLFTSPVRASGYKRQEYSGTTAEDTDKAAAQQMLNDFFKTLYSEPQNKIDYYLSDDADKQKLLALELAGNINFQRIESLSLYKTATENEFLGIVTIRVYDSNNTEMRQRFNILLVKKDKFYTKDINLRSYNLKT